MRSDRRRRNDESAFLRLLAVLILLTVLPCAVISYIIYSIARSAHIEQTSVLLNSLAADRELTTRLLIEKKRDELDYLTKDPRMIRLAGELAGGYGQTNSDFMEHMVEHSRFFVGMSLVDIATGRYRTGGAFPSDIIERSISEIKQRPKKTFVRMEILPDDRRVMLIGQSMQGSENDSGRSRVLLGLARLATFDELYKDTSMLGVTGESFLADYAGFAFTPLRYSTHRESHAISAEAMKDCLRGNSKAFVITPDYISVPTAMSYRPVQHYGGCVMVHMRASEVMAPINTLRGMVLAIVATIIAASALMAFLVVTKLLRMDKERKLLEEDLERHSSRMETMVAERTVELKSEIKTRMDAELKLRENEAFLENIVHNVHEVIFAVTVGVDSDFRLMWWNANGEKLFGAKSSEGSGRTLCEVFGPDTGGRLSAHYRECISRGVIHYEEAFKATDGARMLLITLVPVKDETGRVTQIISSAMDITERKKLESEMVKAQKLESLGVLAGGIAHDFNNLLAVIRLNISMLKHGATLNPDSLEMLKLVDNATVLATNLTNQLLTFAKGGKPVIKAVPVREFLSEAANLSLSGTKTTCDLNIADGILDMEADSGQMTQVINNMLLNADQAMPEGGVVALSADNVELTSRDKGLPIEHGMYIKIAIEDRGIGIPEENLSRIFDPYFTTKKKGSGLGLASSYSIIKNHSGHISVRSRVGHGTIFEIFVPAVARKAFLEDERAGDRAKDRAKATGRVLVMDDDDIVRASVCNALKSLGYSVESATNGQDAVLKYKNFRKDGNPFDAVILDLTVPVGMGGEEAVNKILEVDRSAKVFVSSGYSNTAVIADFKKYGFFGFLKKPYDSAELDRTLQAAIRAKKT